MVAINKFAKFDKHFHLVSKERFLSRIIKSNESDCWLLSGRRSAKAYRYLYVPQEGISVLAHRYSFWFYNGSIDSSLVIDHKCMNKSCVNPEHLRNVSLKINATENSSNCMANNTAKTHCNKGHEYDEKNTRHMKGGGRKCRKCHNERSRKEYRRKKNGV